MNVLADWESDDANNPNSPRAQAHKNTIHRGEEGMTRRSRPPEIVTAYDELTLTRSTRSLADETLNDELLGCLFS